LGRKQIKLRKNVSFCIILEKYKIKETTKNDNQNTDAEENTLNTTFGNENNKIESD
jgi:hypothetical protein